MQSWKVVSLVRYWAGMWFRPCAGAAEKGRVLFGGRRIWKSFMEEVVFDIRSEQGKIFLRRDQHVQRPGGRNEQVFFRVISSTLWL